MNALSQSGPPVRFLTVPQVAQWTTWSTRTIWEMLARGELTRIRLGRRCTRIDAAEVERLIERARGRALPEGR